MKDIFALGLENIEKIAGVIAAIGTIFAGLWWLWKNVFSRSKIVYSRVGCGFSKAVMRVMAGEVYYLKNVGWSTARNTEVIFESDPEIIEIESDNFSNNGTITRFKNPEDRLVIKIPKITQGGGVRIAVKNGKSLLSVKIDNGDSDETEFSFYIFKTETYIILKILWSARKFVFFALMLIVLYLSKAPTP